MPCITNAALCRWQHPRAALTAIWWPLCVRDVEDLYLYFSSAFSSVPLKQHKAKFLRKLLKNRGYLFFPQLCFSLRQKFLSLNAEFSGGNLVCCITKVLFLNWWVCRRMEKWCLHLSEAGLLELIWSHKFSPFPLALGQSYREIKSRGSFFPELPIANSPYLL